MRNAIVLLVGDQPVPNLLPTRHLKPDVAVLLHTDRTRRVAENLARLLEPGVPCLLCPVCPYDVPEILSNLQRFLSEKVPDHGLTFNVTGGTKPMALAAFSLARVYDKPFVYFQTEGNCSRLYHYAFATDGIRAEGVEDLPETIILDEYLRAYLGSYETGGPRDEFERQVSEVLNSASELEVCWSVRPQGLDALEIDFAVRLGNQVGVGEVKTKGAKAGIDQINAIAEQRYLGTYVRKFLISGRPVDRNNLNLAQAYSIKVIELLSYSEHGILDGNDRRKMVQTLRTHLGVAL
jgi:hypothetical protein